MLRAREENERVRGLATGADDYMVKPFSVPELLARVRTILRRANPDAVAEVLKAGDIALDRRARRVTRSKRDIELSPTEFRLLEHLMQNPGRSIHARSFLDAVWAEIEVDERTLTCMWAAAEITPTRPRKRSHPHGAQHGICL